jgi:hypothetical protein
MRLRLAWLLLPLVSACASGPTGNGPLATCHREALNDPAVRQIAVEQMYTGVMSPKAQFAYNQALHDAYNNCLLRHGLAVQGGVEAVRPTD